MNVYQKFVVIVKYQQISQFTTKYF